MLERVLGVHNGADRRAKQVEFGASTDCLCVQLIGLEATDSFRDADVVGMVRRHLTQLRRDPRYEAALMVIFIEANMSYIGADRLAGIIASTPLFAPSSVESKDPRDHGRVGVWTGPTEKKSMAEYLRLVIEEDTLCVADRLVGHKTDRDFDELMHQLACYRRHIVEPREPGIGTWKETFTGKGPGKKDDLAMTLQLALWWGERTRTSYSFQQKALRNGWRLV